MSLNRGAAPLAAICFLVFAALAGCESDSLLGGSDVDGGGSADIRDIAAADTTNVVNCKEIFLEWKVGQSCNDGSPCIINATCRSDGSCIGTPLACYDGKECTADSCDPLVETGCVFTPRSSGTMCNDESECTTSDECTSAGECTGKIPALCDDGNICTTDSCSPQTGCKFTFKPGAPCEDGSLCTKPDLCIEGVCKPGGQLVCNDGNPCTLDTCDAQSGDCIYQPFSEGVACNDGDACTVGDACKDAQCKSGALQSCNDGDACTTDSCNKANGSCLNIFTSNLLTPCSDGDACTENDKCDPGLKKCQGTLKSCNDQNLCTLDTCDVNGGCSNTSAEGSSCSDGNACTQDDKCKQSSCVAGTIKGCNDNNACTSDLCNQDTGSCLNTPTLGVQCNDGNKCTLDDICTSGGVCSGAFAGCSDGNPCTSDSCNPSAGCIYEQVSGLPCSDGNPCTAGDNCKGGVCSYLTDDCDDKSDCTADTCDVTNGTCTHTILYDTAVNYACSDGNPCTIDGICLSSGKCELVGPKCDDKNACTQDSCVATTGACNHKPIPGCN